MGDVRAEDGAWGEWVRRWTAEEGRHAIVLRDYLTVTRGMDPVALERGRMETVSRGYYPSNGGSFANPLDGLVYTSLQELATRIAHRNTGAFTKDPAIEKLTARIATDENLHYVFYRELAKAALEIDPSAMMMAIKRQVIGFAMPGLEIPEFQAKAIEIAKHGIYDLRIHHDQVVLPVLFKHWRIDELDGPVRRSQARPGGDHELPGGPRRHGHDVRGEARRPHHRLGATQPHPTCAGRFHVCSVGIGASPFVRTQPPTPELPAVHPDPRRVWDAPGR